MTANDILRHLFPLCPWVNPDTIWDRVISGDGDKPIARTLVAWQSTQKAIAHAIAGGFDLLITHEPTYWGYSDAHERELHFLSHPDDYRLPDEKLRLLHESGLVVLRLHDTWDRFPVHGVPYAWARHLGFCAPPSAVSDDGYLLAFDVPEQPARQYAAGIARACALLGEPAVQFVGSDTAPVRRIGVGTGCVCDPQAFWRMGCDLCVTTDDGLWYWGPLSCAIDLDAPVVRVNHRTSEEPGMQSLAAYLRNTLQMQAEYFYEGCSYRLVQG